MRNTPSRAQEDGQTYDRLQRLAGGSLELAVEQGIARAHRLRAEVFRDAFHQAGLGLGQLFGLRHNRQAVPLRRAGLSHR